MNQVTLVHAKLPRAVAESIRQYSHLPITHPSRVASIVRALVDDRDREMFVALHLDARNKLRNVDIVSIGTMVASLVDPRELYRLALLTAAVSIIVAHNHPSGDSAPSPEDLQITDRLAAAGRIIGIELLDHVIVTAQGHYSIKMGGEGE